MFRSNRPEDIDLEQAQASRESGTRSSGRTRGENPETPMVDPDRIMRDNNRAAREAARAAREAAEQAAREAEEQAAREAAERAAREAEEQAAREAAERAAREAAEQASTQSSSPEPIIRSIMTSAHQRLLGGITRNHRPNQSRNDPSYPTLPAGTSSSQEVMGNNSDVNLGDSSGQADTGHRPSLSAANTASGSNPGQAGMGSNFTASGVNQSAGWDFANINNSLGNPSTNPANSGSGVNAESNSATTDLVEQWYLTSTNSGNPDVSQAGIESHPGVNSANIVTNPGNPDAHQVDMGPPGVRPADPAGPTHANTGSEINTEQANIGNHPATSPGVNSNQVNMGSNSGAANLVENQMNPSNASPGNPSTSQANVGSHSGVNPANPSPGINAEQANTGNQPATTLEANLGQANMESNPENGLGINPPTNTGNQGSLPFPYASVAHPRKGWVIDGGVEKKITGHRHLGSGFQLEIEVDAPQGGFKDYELVAAHLLGGDQAVSGYIEAMEEEGREPYYIQDGDIELLRKQPKSRINIVARSVFRRYGSGPYGGYLNAPAQRLKLTFDNGNTAHWYSKGTVTRYHNERWVESLLKGLYDASGISPPPDLPPADRPRARRTRGGGDSGMPNVVPPTYVDGLARVPQQLYAGPYNQNAPPPPYQVPHVGFFNGNQSTNPYPPNTHASAAIPMAPQPANPHANANNYNTTGGQQNGGQSNSIDERLNRLESTINMLCGIMQQLSTAQSGPAVNPHAGNSYASPPPDTSS